MQGSEFPLEIESDLILLFLLLMFFVADDIDQLAFIKIEDNIYPPFTNWFHLDDVSGFFLGEYNCLLFGQFIYLCQNISQYRRSFKIMFFDGFLDLALDLGFDRFRVSFEK